MNQPPDKSHRLKLAAAIRRCFSVKLLQHNADEYLEEADKLLLADLLEAPVSSIGARELLLDIYQADVNGGAVTFDMRERILKAVGLEAWSCAQQAQHGVRCSCWCGIEGRCTASFKNNERTGLGAATEPSSLADAKAPTAEAASAPLSAIVRSDEDGWLVEVTHNDLAQWWAGGPLPWENFGTPTWTRDAFEAVRFCRERDAQRAIMDWPAWMQREVKVTGHLFLNRADDGGQKNG